MSAKKNQLLCVHLGGKLSYLPWYYKVNYYSQPLAKPPPETVRVTPILIVLINIHTLYDIIASTSAKKSELPVMTSTFEK